MSRPRLTESRRVLSLENLPENELDARLDALTVRKATAGDTRLDDAMHNIQVYQVELEMQNRALQEAQIQLEVSCNRYSDLFEFAPVGYCIIDANGKFLKVNRTAALMLCHTRKLDHSVTLGECVASSDRALMARHFNSCLRARRELSVELRTTGYLGRMFDVHLAAAPEIDEHGGLIGFKVALIDISKRKATEARLQLMSQASEALASSLNYVDSVSGMLMHLKLCFAQTCFIDLILDSREPLRLHPATLGSEEEAAYASESESLFPQREKNTPQAQVLVSGLPMRTAGLPQEDEKIALELRQGNRSMLVVPLVAHGKTLGTMTCIASAGQIYESDDLAASSGLAHRVAMAVHSGVLHEQVQEAVRARQMILATVSHDVKNVLTSVKMRSELLLNSADPYTSEQGAAIDRSAVRMDKMLDDLMDIASIERGQLSMRPGTQNVDTLVTEALESHRSEALVRNIRLEADNSALSMFCDAERFLQVLSNLLSNAIKFSPDGGLVSVKACEEGDFVRIGVADRGIGIAPELVTRVFDQYWQAPGTRSKGRGLGLAICQGIAAASNGRIWAASTLGKGSTFYFTVPLATRHKTSAAITPNRHTILVVEDDEDLRLATCEILRNAGYRVQSACNGKEGLQLSKAAHAPALVLLDLEMPVVSGWEFLRVRQGDPTLKKIKVVVMSALSAARELVAQRGAIFLNKPLRAQNLLDRISLELQQEA